MNRFAILDSISDVEGINEEESISFLAPDSDDQSGLGEVCIEPKKSRAAAGVAELMRTLKPKKK